MRSVMKHSFSEMPEVRAQRSMLDRSFGSKLNFNVGDLVPIFWDEILPGDTVSLSADSLIRLATPLHPIMDNMFLDTFFFFVPNRLLWDNWQKFMGEQIDPGDSTDYVTPKLNLTTNVTDSDIYHLMGGIPIGTKPTGIIAFPWRAYNLIWNEWFRNQNLQDSLTVPKNDGPDPQSTYAIKKRCKRHDYFTSCLPWPQKGDPVDIPIGQTAPVVRSGQHIKLNNNPTSPGLNLTQSYWQDSGSNNRNALRFTSPTSDISLVYFGDQTGLQADLTNVSATTMNELRQAMMIQVMLEKNARYGSRYIEILRSHFGVTSPDARLQRPEYLGGGSSRINVTPIAQTSSTDATSPQGNLGAFGTCAVRGHGFTKSFVEHGQLIGIVNVRADLTYQQGLDRQLTRHTIYDYYWPSLAHIGEQAVLNKEIYVDATAADEDVFGYQERYAEYRYKPSRVLGRFSSLSPATLDSWHLSERFASRPTLSDVFIRDNTPIDRTLAVNTEPDFISDWYFGYRHTRCMPIYGIPGFRPFF